MTGVVVFLGPTAHGLPPLFPASARILPPVRRGDVAAVVDSADPGVLVVVDGTFHSYPSVGHAELRAALDRGWRVWGLSSMGAIRAAEMRHLGMRGFGAVYQRYADDPGFSDDEVTLLHAAEAPHRPMSEPMVHIRSLVAALVADGTLTEPAARAVLAELKNRWYAERTHHALRVALEAHLPPQAAAAALARLPEHRVKTTDLVEFATRRPWL
ncbi:hypothetical protein JOD54_002047 [Actinokineospora baliensis]|uniref:TfuA-like protein n=1 Tax=Actinokineospora baliensis TaxID=547056 RepID=UPI0019560F14|nr:TfuA-like protein [Actinokineospora baliensis]MBM7771843.1 hypothetical protein [Actinokineospora baliensis]